MKIRYINHDKVKHVKREEKGALCLQFKMENKIHFSQYNFLWLKKCDLLYFRMAPPNHSKRSPYSMHN